MKNKTRVDSLLVTRGLAPSRHQAQALVLAGRVFSGEKRIEKPGAQISGETPLSLNPSADYVSRGGIKLAGSLKGLGISIRGKVCLDVGASTGGFTDCLLQNGAARVYAVDVGHGQLHPKLRDDPRVIFFEKSDIRRVEGLPEGIDLAVIDVSFISLTKVLPAVLRWLREGGEIVALVKPQFELTPREVRKGVVRDESLRRKAVDKIRGFIRENGWSLLGEVDSPLPGAKGNREVFLWLQSRSSSPSSSLPCSM